MVVIFILIYCYGSIILILESRLNSINLPSNFISHKNAKMFQRELLLYLTVIISIRLWSVFDRIQNLIDPARDIKLISYLHVIGASIQGAVNCLLLFYGNHTNRYVVGVLMCSCT